MKVFSSEGEAGASSGAPDGRTEPEPWELVLEARRVFGEEAARTLARLMAVPFEPSVAPVAQPERAGDFGDAHDRP